MTRPIVVKVGGELAADAEQLRAIGGDLAAMDCGRVVVHGGGPQATELSKKLGIERRIVGGRRITDQATLDVMKMILGGRLNVDLTAGLGAMGLRTIGLSGVSAHLVRAVKRPPRVVSGGGEEPIDFGLVGDIVSINGGLLRMLLAEGYMPVMNSLGVDEEGAVYNINADIAATRVAAELEAAHLFLVTGSVPGVLRDKDDPSTRIPTMTESQARSGIADGTVQGGMIPKIEESLSVLASGVGAIHILGSVASGDLARAVAEPGSVGTALVAD